MHADEAGGAGQHRADQKADRGNPGEQPPGESKDDDADDGDRGVLAREIGLRTLADRGGDFLHARVALIGREDRARCPARVGEGKQPAKYNNPNYGHIQIFPLDLPENPSPGR